jgi:hypothetical protein
MIDLVTAISRIHFTPLQGFGCTSNCIGILIPDELPYGLNGRKVAQGLLLAGLLLFSVDRGLRAYKDDDAVLWSGTIALLTGVGRLAAMITMPNATIRDRHRRRYVVTTTFALGSALAIGTTCWKAKTVEPIPTLLIASGLYLASRADYQDLQHEARKRTLGSAACFGFFALYNGEAFMLASNAVSAGFLMYKLKYPEKPVNGTPKPEPQQPHPL